MLLTRCSIALLSITLVSFAASSCGFVVKNISSKNVALPMANSKHKHRIMNLNMSSRPPWSSPSKKSSINVGRRDVIKSAGSLLTLSTIMSSVNVPVVQAKDKGPVSISVVREAFQAVRDVLKEGGEIDELGALVEKEDYEAIMEFTKGYDLDFRKAKMGKARKFLTNKEDKERAVLNCNAVTFDLIGMNKGSRVGQRDIEQVKKYYGELKADIQTFLELESNIDVAEYLP